MATDRRRKQRDKYLIELKENMDEARKREKKSQAVHLQSETHHQVANRTDHATLLLELGIVITSLAVLTRKRSYWIEGVILSAMGAVYGGYVLIPHLVSGH